MSFSSLTGYSPIPSIPSGFNPCFSGCLSPVVEKNMLRALLHYRFNPCFSGCLSPVPSGASAVGDYTSFNPCFSGCLSPVLLLPQSKRSMRTSFNPCFSGCLSPVQADFVDRHEHTGVSILVLVDVFLQYYVGCRVYRGCGVFQSLF